MRGRYSWGRLAAVTALLLTLAGCSQVVSGSASVDPSTAQSSPSERVVAPASDSAAANHTSTSGTSETTRPPGTTPSTGSTTSSAAGATAGADFTNVDFVTPADFVKPTGYSVAVPLEAHHISVFFAPEVAPKGLDVLSVSLYALPGPGLADTPAQQLNRVEQYNTKVQAKVIGAIKRTPLAGRPGFTENVTQPPNYSYVTWFAFGSRHLLQLSCQYDKSALKSTIDKGCASLRSSLTLS